jgi:hypothetical protein
MVRSIGYDPSNCTLELEFDGGRVYRYSEVPELVYRALMRSESKHEFFMRAVEGRYPFERVHA